jgi:hypothetical protein
LLATQLEGREKRGKGLPEREKTVALPRIELGRGEREVVDAGAGKEVLGATLL